MKGNGNYKWWVLITIATGSIMVAIDLSILTTCLPQLAKVFHVDSSVIGWLNIVCEAYGVGGKLQRYPRGGSDCRLARRSCIPGPWISQGHGKVGQAGRSITSGTGDSAGARQLSPIFGTPRRISLFLPPTRH
jgi:hypothetical protein